MSSPFRTILSVVVICLVAQISSGGQAIIGWMETGSGDLAAEVIGGGDPNVTAVADLSELPVIGYVSQAPLSKKRFELGFEGGVLFSWERDKVESVGATVGTGGGSIYVSVDNALFLFDIFAGAYIAKDLGSRLQLYAGAGPMVMLGIAEIESSDTTTGTAVSSDDSDTVRGYGLYVRTGVDLVISEFNSIGLGVRAYSADVDAGNSIGHRNLESVQWMLTYANNW